MFDRRFVGLNSQFISVSPRFASSGTILHVLRPYHVEAGVALSSLFWIRSFITVSIRIGGAMKNFVLKPTSQIEYLRNPIIILRNAIQSARNNQLLLSTWVDLFSRNRPVIAVDEVRYYLLATVFQHNSRTYNPPLGYLPGSPLVMLHLSKTAGEGIVRQVIENNVDPFDSSVLFELTPDASSGSQFAPNRYAVHKREIKGFNFEPIQRLILERKYNWDDDSILKEPSCEEQIQLLQYSDVPATAVAYALAETEYRNLFTKAYLDAALAKLEAAMGRRTLPAGPVMGYGVAAAVPEAPQPGYSTYTAMAPSASGMQAPMVVPMQASPTVSPSSSVSPVSSGTQNVIPLSSESQSAAIASSGAIVESGPNVIPKTSTSQPGPLPAFIAQLLQEHSSKEEERLTPTQFNQFLNQVNPQRKALE